MASSFRQKYKPPTGYLDFWNLVAGQARGGVLEYDRRVVRWSATSQYQYCFLTFFYSYHALKALTAEIGNLLSLLSSGLVGGQKSDKLAGGATTGCREFTLS